ncbi:MAG: head-tail connector protein [Bacteroidota bacterium]|nr:head-tail connector protein [Bacteroidota bacterium]
MIQNNQLITLEELKRYLNWASNDTVNDDFLNDMINAVSNLLEQYCNTKLKKCDVEELVSGAGAKKIYLSNRPIETLKSLKHFDGSEFVDYMTSQDIAKYIVLLDHAVYHRADVFEEGVFNYKIEYTCGYDPIPPDLKLAAQELCAVLFRNSFKSEGRVGLISNQQGNFKMFYLEQLPMHTQIINKYRLVNI